MRYTGTFRKQEHHDRHVECSACVYISNLRGKGGLDFDGMGPRLPGNNHVEYGTLVDSSGVSAQRGLRECSV